MICEGGPPGYTASFHMRHCPNAEQHCNNIAVALNEATTLVLALLDACIMPGDLAPLSPCPVRAPAAAGGNEPLTPGAQEAASDDHPPAGGDGGATTAEALCSGARATYRPRMGGGQGDAGERRNLRQLHERAALLSQAAPLQTIGTPSSAAASLAGVTSEQAGACLAAGLRHHPGLIECADEHCCCVCCG
jgi:hypothetical protein